MCMQSVSLWAEATWYRLGGSRPDRTDVVTGDPAADPAGGRAASETPESVEPAVQVDEAGVKVLVGR